MVGLGRKAGMPPPDSREVTAQGARRVGVVKDEARSRQPEGTPWLPECRALRAGRGIVWPQTHQDFTFPKNSGRVEMWLLERPRETAMRALNQPVVQDQIKRVVPLALSIAGVGNLGQMVVLWEKKGLVPEQVTGFSVAFADRVSLVESIVNGESVFQMYYHGLAGSEPAELGAPIAAHWRVAAEQYVATLAERHARQQVQQSFRELDRPRREQRSGGLPHLRFGA